MKKMEEKHRICSPQMSLSSENIYGGGIYHLKLLEHLADAGVECIIPLAFNAEYEPRENWDVFSAPIRRTYKLGALISNAVFLSQLIWIWVIARRRFDVLRVTDPYYVGPAALIFHCLTSVPLIANVFHIEPNQYLRNAILKFVCRRCDAVVVTSSFSKKQVEQALSLDPDKVHVTYGGVTVFEGAPKTREEAKKNMGVTGKTVIGFIGALSERKNPGFLLEIFADLFQRDDRRHLIFVGSDISADGSLMNRLRRRAKELNIEKHVTFAGRVDTRAKATILKAMDLFVFPSLMEGFGLAVVEALAAGVPVVVSDRGSLPEVVRHGESGLVLSLEDRETLTRKIDELLGDEQRLERMKSAARTGVVSDFSWEACAQRTIAVHETVVKKRKQQTLGVILNSGDSMAVMAKEGGWTRFRKHYLSRWSEAFDAVEVFGYGDENDTPLSGVRFVPAKPQWRGLLYAMLMPGLHRERFRSLKMMRVMHAGAALPAIIANGVWKIPFVVTYGYRYGRFMKIKGRPVYAALVEFVSRCALRRSAAVIVTTPALEAHVRSLIGPEKIVLIPNGVDLSLFQSTGNREKTDPSKIVFTGRLTEQKNLTLLAESLSPLKDRVSLSIVGDGPLRGELEALFTDKGIDARFFGAVDHEKLPEIYAEASIFVLPSRIEGHPKALIEAMASGLACLASDVEGNNELIIHEQTGLLAPLNAALFTKALERLIDDPRFAKELGGRAAEYAAEHFDIDKLMIREIELLTAIRDKA
jgi:glycosyltransferase involved in cell wall biosynthesis